MLLDPLSARGAIELVHAANDRHELRLRLDDVARNAVGDDLRSGAAPHGDDRRPARHRLGGDEAECLFRFDRSERCERAAEQRDLLAVVELAEVDDVVAELRLDVALEVVALVLGMHLRRDPELEADLARSGDRAMAALVRTHPADEREV